jgi:hypothetical protein
MPEITPWSGSSSPEVHWLTEHTRLSAQTSSFPQNAPSGMFVCAAKAADADASKIAAATTMKVRCMMDGG